MATMTAPFLNPPVQEDSMELSSPGNRPLDEDIDIDFDGEVDIMPSVDDDRMEDGIEHNSRHEQDEDMLHVEDDVQNTDPERFSTIPDEDLIDYSDDEETTQLTANVVEDEQVTELADDQHEGTNDVDGGLAAPTEDVGVDLVIDASAEAGEDVTTAIENNVQGRERFDEHTNQASLNAEAAEFVPVQADRQADETELQLPEEGDLNPRLSTTSFDPITEGPGTPTDTGLHPIILYYAEQEYPLFRTRALNDGLLKDDNLASISLADLIKACRQSLIIRTQQDVDDSLEMVLTFDNLALSVSEDAPAAFRISLKDVLDVYVQLQTNDGHEEHEVPPLEISCSLQIKFNSSIVILRNAAERGEGLSSIVPTHEDAHEQTSGEVGDSNEQVYHDEEEVNQDEDEQHVEQEDGHIDVAEREGEYNEAEEAHDQQDQHTAEHDQADSTNTGDIVEQAEHDDEEQSTLDNEHTPATLAALDSAGDTEPAHEAEHDTFTVADQADEAPDASLDAHAVPNQTDEQPELETTATNVVETSHEAAELAQADHTEDAPEQSTEIDAKADADDAGSDFEFDLEDYDHPDASVTTSPSTKRQRETEGPSEDNTVTKKPRPS